MSIDICIAFQAKMRCVDKKVSLPLLLLQTRRCVALNKKENSHCVEGGRNCGTDPLNPPTTSRRHPARTEPSDAPGRGTYVCMPTELACCAALLPCVACAAVRLLTTGGVIRPPEGGGKKNLPTPPFHKKTKGKGKVPLKKPRLPCRALSFRA